MCQTGGNYSPIIASKAPGILKTRMAWTSPAIVVIIEDEKMAMRRVRSPEGNRTSRRIQSGAMTRMKSDSVEAVRSCSTAGESWLGKTRRTRQFGDSNGVSEHTLGVRTLLPQDIHPFTHPEHLSEEENQLKQEENSDAWEWDRVSGGSIGCPKYSPRSTRTCDGYGAIRMTVNRMESLADHIVKK